MKFPHNLKVILALFLVSYVCLQIVVIQRPVSVPTVSRIHNTQDNTTSKSLCCKTGREIQNMTPDSNVSLLQDLNYLNNSRNMTDEDSGNKSVTISSHQLETLVSTTLRPESRCGDHVRLLQGHKRPYKGFLTIGLCSVPREKAFYLKDTLHSLISGSTESERETVVIVVFLDYKNETLSNGIQEMIVNNFSDNLEKGEIQVVQPDMVIYPNFSQIRRRTFNDSIQRVRWRTKQNIDFAYLFGYCDGISEYYVHIEDDVLASPNYISKMKQHLSFHKRLNYNWFVLEFGYGFYGKLFRSLDLCMMKSSFLLFKEEKPCDLLLEDFMRIKQHDFKKVKKGANLFKHMGKYSSLEGKIVEEKGRKMPDNNLPKTTEQVYVSRLRKNPDALIETSMKAYLTFTPEFAYEINNTVYFWAFTPKAGDYYRVILNTPVQTTRVTVRTGMPITGEDKLDNAVVFINKELTSDGKCRSEIPLGRLTSGKFEHLFTDAEELKCLEIVVQHKQPFWVVIAQIEIETQFH